MPAISSTISSFLNNAYKNRNVLIVLFVILMLTSISLYYYFYYVKPRYEGLHNLEHEQNNRSKNAKNTLKIYYADWCPHCTKAMPVVEDIVSNEDDVVLEKIDCSTEGTCDKYNVEGYPTIRFVDTAGKETEFSSNINKNTLQQFIDSAKK